MLAFHILRILFKQPKISLFYLLNFLLTQMCFSKDFYSFWQESELFRMNALLDVFIYALRNTTLHIAPPCGWSEKVQSKHEQKKFPPSSCDCWRYSLPCEIVILGRTSISLCLLWSQHQNASHAFLVHLSLCLSFPHALPGVFTVFCGRRV